MNKLLLISVNSPVICLENKQFVKNIFGEVYVANNGFKRLILRGLPRFLKLGSCK